MTVEEKRAYAVWPKEADWPKNTVHKYVWAYSEDEAKKLGARLFKTVKRNMHALLKPIDFKTPYTYPG